MKAIYKGIFMCLCVMLALVSPVIATDQEGQLKNTAPTIQSITVDEPSIFTVGGVTEVPVTVIAEDLNGWEDLKAVNLDMDFESGGSTYQVITKMSDTTPTEVGSNTASFEFTIEIPSSWNAGDYTLIATPFDTDEGTPSSSDGINYEYLTVPTMSGLSCDKVVYADFNVKDQNVYGDIVVANEGNSQVRLNFDFTGGSTTNGLYLDADTGSTEVIAGSKLTCDLQGDNLGFEGTPIIGGEYLGTGNTPLSGKLRIDIIPESLRSGSYIGTFEVTAI